MKHQNFWLRLIGLVVMLGLLSSAGGAPVQAQDPQPPRAPTPPPLSQVHDPLKDAQSTTGPVPPSGALLSPSHAPSATAVTLDVPAYSWRHGCGPTAAGMVIGYWDSHGFPALISGDAWTQTPAVNEAIASSNGIQSHYTDYVLPMETGSESEPLPDKSEPPVGDEHPSNSLGDFMHTSWSADGNFYGWSWFSGVAPAFSGYVNYVNQTTGSHYAAITHNYYMSDGSLNWSLLKNEIDAGRPVVFLVDSNGDGYTDHFVTVRGYDESGGVQYYGANNTWDTLSEPHWYEFGPMQIGKPWGVYGAITLQLKDLSSLDHSVFLPLIFGPSPDLRLQSYSVYDGTEDYYFSFGNGDHQPNPGETIYLEVNIKNFGTGKALDVFASLSTTDPYVNAYPAYDGYEWMDTYIDQIDPGSSENAGFRLLINSNTPSGHTIPFHLTVRDSEGKIWAFDFSLVVNGFDATPPEVLWADTWPKLMSVSQPTYIYAFVLEPGTLKSVTAKVYKTTSSTPVATLTLYDDGSHGDYMAGDRTFTNQFTPSTANDFYVDVTATDSRNNTQTRGKMAGFSSKVFTATSNNLLLVLDQQSYNEVNVYYTGALSANGYTYDLWDGFYRGELDTSVLSSYVNGVVIYAMPNSGWLTDDSSDVRDGLKSYLDSGGRLFITGQDIGFYFNLLSDESFYTDYLRANYLVDDTNLSRLNGVLNDPISDGLSLSIADGDGANNQVWPDGISALSPAVPILYYDSSSGATDADRSEGSIPFLKEKPQGKYIATPSSEPIAGALRVEENGHRVVYFSFGFEAINGAAVNTRAQVLKRVIDWLTR